MAAGRILGQDSYLQHRKYQKPPGSLPVLIFSTYTQYRPIRHRLFTDTPRTDLSDTCSSQIHALHTYCTRYPLFPDALYTVSQYILNNVQYIHTYQKSSQIYPRHTFRYPTSQIHPVHTVSTRRLHSVHSVHSVHTYQIHFLHRDIDTSSTYSTYQIHFLHRFIQYILVPTRHLPTRATHSSYSYLPDTFLQ